MANCSCIRGNYNFYAREVDKNGFRYQDLSDWMDEPGYTIPTTYSVTITPPATRNSVTLNLTVGGTNYITKEQLGSLKDGIYCFEVTSCGISYKRSIGLFPEMRCCIRQLYATENDPSKAQEVDNYLERASINIEFNNIQLAEKNLKIARRLLDNLKCSC